MVLTKSETVEYCCSEISDRRGGEKESSGGRMGGRRGSGGRMGEEGGAVVEGWGRRGEGEQWWKDGGGGGEGRGSGGRMGEEGGKEGAVTQHHLLVVKLTVCHSHWPPPSSSSNTLNPPSNRKAATIALISLSLRMDGWTGRQEVECKACRNPAPVLISTDSLTRQYIGNGAANVGML